MSACVLVQRLNIGFRKPPPGVFRCYELVQIPADTPNPLTLGSGVGWQTQISAKKGCDKTGIWCNGLTTSQYGPICIVVTAQA